MTGIQSNNHQDRINRELKEAGMKQYGFLKAETRHLPSIIKEDEHIHGVIYGRAEGGSAMLVATNQRLLYLDHKLFFKKTEDISYDVLGGVSYSKQGEHGSVTVHTKMGNFNLRYVNRSSADQFVDYLEKIQIQRDEQQVSQPPVLFPTESGATADFSQKARLFMANHDLGVVSTVDEHGNVHGAVVYYVLGADNQIFFVTKSKTKKARDLLSYHQIAFTVYDAQLMETVQISGTASIETDVKLAEDVGKRILRPRLASKHLTMPPIMHLSAGDYVVICIKPTSYQHHTYKSW